MSSYSVSIIIPAHNEEHRLPRTLTAVSQFLDNKSVESEIIVVTDGSSDGTNSLVLRWQKQRPNIRLLSYSENLGKGFAVRAGMLNAKYSYRLFMDADYAVPIEFLDSFIERSQRGADIVVASRGMSDSRILCGQSFIRRRLADLFGFVQRNVLQLNVIDTQCGFKLFTADSAKLLFSRTKFNCSYFDAELVYLAQILGMKIDEVGVEWTHDQETRLPIGPKRSIEILWKLFTIRHLHANSAEPVCSRLTDNQLDATDACDVLAQKAT